MNRRSFIAKIAGILACLLPIIWKKRPISDGLSFVTAGERHEIDENLVLAQLGQNRQLMAESRKGFFYADFKYAVKPVNTEWEIPIFYERNKT